MFADYSKLVLWYIFSICISEISIIRLSDISVTRSYYWFPNRMYVIVIKMIYKINVIIYFFIFHLIVVWNRYINYNMIKKGFRCSMYRKCTCVNKSLQQTLVNITYKRSSTISCCGWRQLPYIKWLLSKSVIVHDTTKH